MFTIQTDGLPIYVWGAEVDDSTLAQAKNLARLPFAHHHVALMADAHVGFGMPIGGVLAAVGQVIPHAVGLDIGCGMRAWRTGIPFNELRPARDAILNDIQRSVPTGFEWHKTSQAEKTALFDDMPDVPALRAERAKAEMQLGSLGGGNHFLELQVDEEGIVWAMVHSGSRNLGKQMGERYDAIAREWDRAHASPVPAEWGLAHVPIDSPAGEEYLEVMAWCLRFAEENRRLMAEQMARAIERHFPGVERSEEVAIHHNYAALEEHYGERVVIHRKGAVHACGRVIVPGSMGTTSYIGDGTCSPESFESCSHGAGRAMGRREAKRRLQRDQVLGELASRDVRLYKAKKGDVAEEAPEAYKDIEDVMKHQVDLVRPVYRLRPVGVVKG